MFDLITGKAAHLPRRSAVPIVISTSVQAIVIAGAVAVPVLFMADRIPAVPTMLAFVASPPPPPPPPPPPAPPAKAPSAPKPVTTASADAAPVEPPSRIEPEIGDDEGFDEGVPGGVEGGIPGGVIGGVLGGIAAVPPPPPPPPAPPRGPVRVGGQIREPTLLHRVEPIYPPVAVHARLTGTVILEALVDAQGNVAEVTVLRSANALLDRAAVDAVRQWRYSPLVLNGIPERFLLTVALRFNLVDG